MHLERHLVELEPHIAGELLGDLVRRRRDAPTHRALEVAEQDDAPLAGFGPYAGARFGSLLRTTLSLCVRADGSSGFGAGASVMPISWPVAGMTKPGKSNDMARTVVAIRRIPN